MAITQSIRRETGPPAALLTAKPRRVSLFMLSAQHRGSRVRPTGADHTPGAAQVQESWFSMVTQHIEHRGLQLQPCRAVSPGERKAQGSSISQQHPDPSRPKDWAFGSLDRALSKLGSSEMPRKSIRS